MSVSIPSSPGSSSQDIPSESENVGVWKEYETKEGRKYYHNKELNVTTWKQPEHFISLAARRKASTGELII
jgi:hypothetical protein